MNTNKQYRKLKMGEIVHVDDEYIGVFSNGKYIPVEATTVGQPLLSCNVKYYRRPIMSDIKIPKNQTDRKMFNAKNYEKFADSLNCSEEILAAIETVSEEKFRFGYLMDSQTIIENSPFQLWRDGGQEDEILAALPTDHNPEDGAEIYWGGDIFAKFDENAGKWIKK